MKPISIVIPMLLVISNYAYSQVNQTSPVIHSDNSVSFSFVAPDAKEVILKGSFLQRKSYIKTESGAVTKDGSVKMTREGNRWIYTTAPLPSEFYTYTFEIDGKPRIDRNNKNVIRDIADSLNYFVIRNGIADNYVVNDVPHGTVKKVWYPSTLDGMDKRRMTVYLPTAQVKSTLHKKEYNAQKEIPFFLVRFTDFNVFSSSLPLFFST